ncbi:MAG: FAD:protein FMN transferase [Roseiflexaceae bacterium]
MVELTFRAMGSQILVVLESRHVHSAASLGWIPALFEQWEQCLSRFRPTSELSQLNARPQEWVMLSPILWQVVDVALQVAKQSDGIVTPTILPALQAAGYRHSFDSAGGVLAEQEAPFEQQMAVLDWRLIDVDQRHQAIRLPAGMQLDLGGIAKGWAAEQIADLLAPMGAVLVDAGGDIAIRGPRHAGQPWVVGVAAPLGSRLPTAHPHEDLAILQLQQGAVATSGRDYRTWMQGGQRQHHLIDPRTGQPATTDLLSVTVVAPTLVLAEMAAKRVMILGSSAGLEWIETQPELAALLVDQQDRQLISSRFGQFCWQPIEVC